MARKTRHFTATAIAAAPAAAPLAGADPIIIDQVQLNGTLGALIVEVPGEADAATAVATAVGNTAAGLLDSGSIDAVVTQQASGDSFATAELRGGTVWGPATIASTAYGNAATGLLLVIGLLWFFVGGRNATMAALGVPVALAGAVIGMQLMGIGCSLPDWASAMTSRKSCRLPVIVPMIERGLKIMPASESG